MEFDIPLDCDFTLFRPVHPMRMRAVSIIASPGSLNASRIK
jgi:hypothetical protein